MIKIDFFLCLRLRFTDNALFRVDMEVIKRTGTDHQKWMASRVEPVSGGRLCSSFTFVCFSKFSPTPSSNKITLLQLLVNPHWLLVSLLLINAASYEALPILLDRLLNPVAAILISVTAILIFGEILPQAVCKRYGLQIGAYLSWIVRIIMTLTFPISWPLGKCLDWLLGEETVLFRRAELRELVTLHAEPDEDGNESMLTAEEVQVIHGALDMAHKTAETAMTPLINVFAIEADAIVDRPLLERIISEGHSRVPVYEHGDKKNMIGLILVKELILIDQKKKMKIRDCRLREVDFIIADTPLYSVLELFRLKRKHMAVLTQTISSGNGSEAPPQESNIPGSAAAAAAAAAAADSGGIVENTSRTEADGLISGNDNNQLINIANTNITTTNTSTKGENYEGVELSKISAGAHHTQGHHQIEVVGVITIEDVIEELLNLEIIDETDVYIDNEQTRRVVPHNGKELPPKLSRYLSMKRKGKIISPSSSPSKPPGQNAAAAAAAAGAAAAAYAAAKSQHGGKSAGGPGI